MNVKEYRAQVEAQLGGANRAASAAPAAKSPSPEKIWQDALAKLSNAASSDQERKQALQVLQAGTFLGQKFDSVRAQYTDALRRAATDADMEIRHFALDVLVDSKDAVARQLLTDGLQGKMAPLLPAAAALSLLARDDHGSASAVARDLLSQSGDEATRAQAVRVLGADPSATDLVTEILKNKDEFREVRRAGAVALKGLNPNLFEQSAKEILDDGTDYDDIKSTVGGALERSGISFDRTPGLK
ncbi:hypothetical protein [Bradyrhizobium sp. USDA 10063]